MYFPLFLVFKIHISPKEAINDILNYGIVQYSKQFNYVNELSTYETTVSDLFNVYRQVVYAYYQDKLCFGIDKWINELIDEELFAPNFDYKGFTPDGFEVYEEIDDLVYSWSEDADKQQVCIRFYQMSLAMNSLALTGNLAQIWQNYVRVVETVDHFEKIHGKDALVSVKTELIMDFYKNDKVVEEYELFSAYCAVKSILGQKKYISTNKQFIALRMLGAKNAKVLKAYYDKPTTENGEKFRITAVYDKYLKRYHADKLINTLLSRKFLSSKIGMKGTRKLYLSCNLNFTELAIAVSQSGSSKINREANKRKEHDAIQLLQSLREKRLIES